MCAAASWGVVDARAGTWYFDTGNLELNLPYTFGVTVSNARGSVVRAQLNMEFKDPQNPVPGGR